MDFSNQIILFIGLLFVVSIIASVASARLGAPLLLVFLVIGMVLGQDGLGVAFEDLQTAHLIGSLALAVILFDGGLHTDRVNFRVGLKPALILATVGVVITAAITGTIAAWALGVTLLTGLLIGAIVGSTDAAAVFSLLHTARLELKQRVAATLEIESGSNDPMAIFLTIALLQIITTQYNPGLTVLGQFLLQMGLGGAFGLAGGWLSVRLINRLPLSPGLYPLLALALGLSIFGLTAVTGGSGFLAVYLAGLVMGNARMQSSHNILRFHNGMAWMSQIIMFLMLGLLVTPNQLLPTAPQALLIALALIFLARPIAVVLSLAPFRFSWREQAFISWVGLRGAVPIILAIFPLLAGVDGSPMIFNVAFFVVLVSLILQGWTLPFMARSLQVDIPPSANQVQRLELDLPGHPDYELVGYKLTAESPVAGRTWQTIRMPDQAVPALLLRDEQLHAIDPVAPLAPGDTVYIACPQKAIDVLDRLFVAVRQTGRLADQRFFGEFVLKGDTPLALLGSLYGLDIPVDSSEETLDAFIHHNYPRPVVGDRVRMGSVELVVREMSGDTCQRVGLKLTP